MHNVSIDPTILSAVSLRNLKAPAVAWWGPRTSQAGFYLVARDLSQDDDQTTAKWVVCPLTHRKWPFRAYKASLDRDTEGGLLAVAVKLGERVHLRVSLGNIEDRSGGVGDLFLTEYGPAVLVNVVPEEIEAHILVLADLTLRKVGSLQPYPLCKGWSLQLVAAETTIELHRQELNDQSKLP